MHSIDHIAQVLRAARASATPCPPVRDAIGMHALDGAYAVQDINIAFWRSCHRCVGHKLGFASRLSQRQAGLQEPIYGMLFADMAYAEDDQVPLDRFCHPKVEAEVAFVLAQDVPAQEPTYADVVGAIGFALPAVEIVDPRLVDWNMSPVDAVADNAGAAGFVLGGFPRPLQAIDFSGLGANLLIDGKLVSSSGDEMFEAHPLASALWIARHLARRGRALRAGDVIMAGALGPPVGVHPGAHVRAEIAGLGSVQFTFT